MIASRHRSPLLLSLAALMLPLGGAAQSAAAPADRIAPAPHCLDARNVRQVEQAVPGAIAVLGSNGQAYQIDFLGQCPGVTTASKVRLDAPAGWACGRASEQLMVDGKTCAIAAVSPINSRDFAETARESSRQYATTLPAVTVTGEDARDRGPRYAFKGSPEFCFATRNVRSWHEDPAGVVVETNPRRNGGHRYYRVELAGCPILDRTVSVDFRSGFQNGLICGNPGDRIVTADSGFADDLRASTPRFLRSDCQVVAVYPKQ